MCLELHFINRCFNKHTEKTPFQILTRKMPDVSNMQKFGSECYTYKQVKGELDLSCDQGVFVGYLALWSFFIYFLYVQI